MRIPIIGEGFGCFSRILGPWDDNFPTNLSNPNSGFGVCIGTHIRGGEDGATLGFITVEMPFNIVGNNGAVPWRLLVLNGKEPDSIYQLQRAVNGWPRFGANDLDKPPLFERMIAATTTINNATSVQAPHYAFPDLSGPSVGPSEIMTVLFMPIFNETGVPGYGAANQSFASLTVGGSFSRRKDSGSSQQTARSISRQSLARR